GCFLFSGDDVEKKIKVLSGGEKARVALAKTMISKANFLLLDEPTNHLDMHSCDLLIEALNKYEGSFILVSHDRYFISKTANKIWEIDNYQIKEFKGNYEEWVEWKQRMEDRKKMNDDPNLGSAARAVNAQPSAISVPVKSTGMQPMNNSPINKEQKKELQKQQRIFQQLEEKVANLTKQKNQLEASLSDSSTYSDKNKFLEAETNYKRISGELSTANKEYEAVFEKIVGLEAALTS
ncbi:MAG TPA: ATP-binding cassette domain-containing protein, partial [Puia sp.]|nr:ATP-binding cassette domain-containing protein [Puia sp.]